MGLQLFSWLGSLILPTCRHVAEFRDCSFHEVLTLPCFVTLSPCHQFLSQPALLGAHLSLTRVSPPGAQFGGVYLCIQVSGGPSSVLGKVPQPPLGTSWQMRFKDETGFSGLAQVDSGFSPPRWGQPQPP